MWFDLLKTVIGSFLGATFAFAFAMWREGKKELKDNCAAGNVATLVLARQLSDYNKTVTSLKYFDNAVLKQNAELPYWMRMVPAVPPLYSDYLKHSLPSLNFITTCPSGPEVLQRLVDAEMKYHYFFAMLAKHAEEMKVAQDRLAASGLDPFGKSQVTELEAAVGFATVARLNSIVKAIFIQMNRDAGFFEIALESLEKLLVAKFEKGTVVKVTELEKSLQEDREMYPDVELHLGGHDV